MYKHLVLTILLAFISSSYAAEESFSGKLSFNDSSPKDFDGDLDKVSFKFTDGNYYTSGSSNSQPITGDYYYNLVGNFQDLTSGGSLDIYLADGWVDGNLDNMYDSGEEIYNPELGSTMVERAFLFLRHIL